MNKTNFKNFIRTIKQSPEARLDLHEKKEIRSALLRDLGISAEAVRAADAASAANASPARTPSPFVSTWTALSMSIRIRAVAVACLAFVIASGGIAYAAEQSLPGDILYPVKTHVNENVVRAVKSPAPAAKAAYEVKLVDKRLNEAEQIERKNAAAEIRIKDKEVTMPDPTAIDEQMSKESTVSKKAEQAASKAAKQRQKRKDQEEIAKTEVVSQSVRAQKAATDKAVLDQSLGAVMSDHKDLIKKWSDNRDRDDADSDDTRGNSGKSPKKDGSRGRN